ncbi:phosphoadenosine phosphosulfate reductase family protein [Erysipelotrichaceae bacterium 66-17]
MKISQKCCANLKKKPFAKYEKETEKTMTITGIRAAEGGIREYQADKHGCVFRDKDGEIYKFNPLSPCSDEFIDWYIEKRKIKLCKLYYEPYNFSRTGCKGCPYNQNIKEDLEKMEIFLPSEYKQCELIWKPVYDEYRRIGYRRMQPYKQLRFDLEEEDEE